MLKREEVVGVLIGLLIVVVVVLCTLPTEESKQINRECYEECKALINQKKVRGMWSGASYFSKLSDCMDCCVEEKNELQ